MSDGRAVLLGCATSTGVPLIGCTCPVCSSTDPHNRRLRASLWLTIDGVRVLIDTSPDLRRQALDNRLPGVDMVFYTHTHADHVHGIDDLRMFNFLQRRPIPLYGRGNAVDHMRRAFPYIFDPDPNYPSAVPRLDLRAIDGPIPCGRGAVVPVPIEHGGEEILGFRVGTLAYLTDISALPSASRPLLDGVRTLIVGALRHEPHPTHMTVRQALALIDSLDVELAVLTHMGHDLDYQVLRASLPQGVVPGYDGMVLPIAWS